MINGVSQSVSRWRQTRAWSSHDAIKYPKSVSTFHTLPLDFCYNMEELQAQLRRLLGREEIKRSRFSLDNAILTDPKVVTALAGFLILLLMVYCKSISADLELRYIGLIMDSHNWLQEVVEKRWTCQCTARRPGGCWKDFTIRKGPSQCSTEI